MSLTILSKSEFGVVVTTDGLERYLNRRPSTNSPKSFKLGPFCGATMTGHNGFISKESSRLNENEVDMHFNDLHTGLHRAHPELLQRHLSPDEITNRLRIH